MPCVLGYKDKSLLMNFVALAKNVLFKFHQSMSLLKYVL